MSIIPRSAQLRQQTAGYIADATSIIGNSLAGARTSPAFADVYRLSLSAEAVLYGLASARLQPRLLAVRSIVLRVPLLVGIGQQSVAMVELRRFVELVCWTVYFSDHPIEWLSFKTASGAGFSQETRKPISYSAHRELSYYVEYARELMDSEPSGLGMQAVEGIKQVSHELNAAVHAGQAARTPSRRPPHDNVSDADWRRFGGLQRRVFSNCCVLLAAYCRPRFDRLAASARAHFDWLVGPKVRKRVRQGPFGLRSR